MPLPEDGPDRDGAATPASTLCPGGFQVHDPSGQCAWRSWFSTTPVPVWVEDFSGVAAFLGDLRSSGVADAAAWLREHPLEARVLASRVRVVDANPAAVQILNAGSVAELLGDLTVGFDDESYGPFLDELVCIAQGKRRFSVDVISRTLDGKRRFLRMQWTAGAGHEEDLAVVFLTAVDITELVLSESSLRTALAAKDFFLREIQHRVRNTLTLIDSLLSMQARSRPESADLLESLARRVDTLAVVHDSLYHRTDPSQADLRDCVEGAARQAFHREGGHAMAELSFSVADMDLPIEIATPVAMVVGELTANAIRYGAPGGGLAIVEVRAAPGPDGRMVLSVLDRGRGLPPKLAPAASRGLGLALVKALAEQLKAELSWGPVDGGSAVTLVFPLSVPRT